jgi:predicted sulfurtransferase
VAWILARHYRTSVTFLLPIDDYKRKTADIVVQGVEWEIKSPIGRSKSTISNQFQMAVKQSLNIVIDARRTEIEDGKIEKAIMLEMKKRSEIRRVIMITKFSKVLAFGR